MLDVKCSTRPIQRLLFNDLGITRDNSRNLTTTNKNQHILDSCRLTSNFIAVTGIGFGDEGKGRALLETTHCIKQHGGKVALVFKVNGGANSGHTADGIKLNLLPCGVVDRNCLRIALGKGVVADPIKLEWEARLLEAKYNLPVYDRLLIDPQTMVSHLLHRIEDKAQEYYRVHILKEAPRGSTGRGITPSFSDEVNQRAIYYQNFLDTQDNFAKIFEQRIKFSTNLIRNAYQVPEDIFRNFFNELQQAEEKAHKDYTEYYSSNDFNFNMFLGEGYNYNIDNIISAYWKKGSCLRSHIMPINQVIINALNEGDFVIGEFGQAFLLDKREGFPPNVTASHTYTPEIYQSAGVPVQIKVHNITCAKAYDTKVGTHIFLSEIEDNHPLGNKLKVHEFGVTTGRQRSVGWFDAVEKAYTLLAGGFNEIVINKLDALSYQDDWQQPGKLKICVSYTDKEGNIINGFPKNDLIRKSLIPVYREFDGWAEDIRNVGSFKDLPFNAQYFVASLYSAIIEIAHNNNSIDMNNLPKIRFIGVGPNPGELISDIPNEWSLLRLANHHS